MSLSGLSSDAKLHLVFTLRNGQKTWCSGTDRKQHPRTFEWLTLPLLDDDARASVPMKIDYAIVAQRRWREMGYQLRLALEPNGPPIDDEPVSGAPEPTNCFVPTDAAGNPVEDTTSPFGYHIIVTRTPQHGPSYCLRFQNPELAAQSIIVPASEGPEAAVRKAQEMGFLLHEPPKANPHRERLLAERQAVVRAAAQQQAGQRFMRRPGDR